MHLRHFALLAALAPFTHFCLAQSCTPTWIPDSNFAVSAPVATPQIFDLKLWDPDATGPLAERIYVSGIFDFAGQTPAANIAYYDTGTTQWTPLASTMSGWVFALAVRPNGEVIAGGNFTSINGVDANYIARWDGTTWHPMGGLANNIDVNVRTMATMPNGDVVVGGNFYTANGVIVRSVARWNGSTWSSLAGGMGDTFGAEINVLKVAPNGDLYAGGTFVAAGGNPANYIARWNGSAWSGLGSGMNANVLSMAFTSTGDLIAGGNFSTAGGIPAQNSARWNGSTWSALSPINNVPIAMTSLPNGEVVAAPNTPQIFRLAGSTWIPIGGGAPNQPVNALATACNGDVIAGGSFTTAGGQPAGKLARWGKPVGCPMLEADFETNTGLNADWTVEWSGGSDTTIVSNGRLSSPAGLAAIDSNNQVYYTSPATWSGNYCGAYGGHIRVEFLSAAGCTGLSGDAIPNFSLEGAGLTLVAQSDIAENLRTQNVNTIPLVAENWRVNSVSGPVATPDQLYNVLRDLDKLKFTQHVRHVAGCNTLATRGLRHEIESIALHSEPLRTSYNFNTNTHGWTGDEDTNFIIYNDIADDIACTETQNGSYRYWVAPDSALGHHRNKYNGVLTFKMQVTHNEQDLPLPLVEIHSDVTGTLKYYTAQKPGVQSESAFFVPLSAIPLNAGEGWTLTDTNLPLNETTMRYVLDSPRKIRIRAEFSTENDVCVLDDVTINTPFSGPACDSIDFNNDTSLFDPQDIEAFLSVYSEGPCIPESATCNDIDFNNDTSLFDPCDINSFLTMYSEGPCTNCGV